MSFDTSVDRASSIHVSTRRRLVEWPRQHRVGLVVPTGLIDQIPRLRLEVFRSLSAVGGC